jgi:hypothetical protein
MRVISILLFSILITGSILSVAGLELATNDQAYMGWPITVTGTHPYGVEGQEIFIAVYPGYSGASPIPGPERSGAMLEAFVTTGEEGKWSYQFVPNYIPGEYLIYADTIEAAQHETLLVPILHSDTVPPEPIQQPQSNLVIPQPDPMIIPTLSEIEETAPLSLLPIAIGVLGGFVVFIQRKKIIQNHN